MIRIEFVDDPRENLARVHCHKSYVVKRKDGSVVCATQNGVPMALSNYSPNGMLLEFALQDASDGEQTLAAFREHAYPRFAARAFLIGGEKS